MVSQKMDVTSSKAHNGKLLSFSDMQPSAVLQQI